MASDSANSSGEMWPYGSDFNYDFHVTLDESVAPLEYNYRTRAEHEQAGTA